eukprot:ANDGO_05079.mRNA.1 putative trehalose-phosphate phosphatase E
MLPLVEETISFISAGLSPGKLLVVFLDFDGTLAPIVNIPSQAAMSTGMQSALESLSKKHPVAIISGRARADVQKRVSIRHIFYAGSHGFDISFPEDPYGFDSVRKFAKPENDNEYKQLLKENATPQELEPYIAEVHSAYEYFDQKLSRIPGCIVEDNKFTLSVHDRMVSSANDKVEIETMVTTYVDKHASLLRLTRGKCVWEIRPAFDWNKGKAVGLLLHLMKRVYKTDNIFPIYIGDDRTDEDAFAVLEDCGAGILVSDEARETKASCRVQSVEEVEHILNSLCHLNAGGELQ